ncbi:O-antigen ligase family protein [Subtercola sp. YIM 133946]|uniref:O-antigen ligase family protein n=1 Tax=Subtercola sp. YIM 133946 TaxID=3118909 RepID=UPI002F92BA79
MQNSSNGWKVVVGGVVVLGIVMALIIWGGDSAGAGIALFFLALVGLAFLFWVRIDLLPAFAFLCLVLVPDRVLVIPALHVVPPETLFMVVWVIRKVFAAKPADVDSTGRGLLRFAVIAMMAWLVILTFLSINTSNSIAWTLSFGLFVALPILVRDVRAESATLARVWLWTGSILALYALLQSLIQANPIYDAIYGALKLGPIQHWVVYRADVSLGHPLTAGLFFATTLALAVGQWIQSRNRIYAVVALVAGLGVVVTVSRGAYVAAGIGVSVVLILAMVSGRRFGRGRLGLIVILFGVFAYFAIRSDTFVERSTSAEGAGSIAGRDGLLDISTTTASAFHWRGSGPGTSGLAAIPYNYQLLPIESAYFQLLISIGIPGLILFAALIAAVFAMLLRRHDIAVAGGLVSLLVAMGGYASIDGIRIIIPLIGFLILIGLGGALSHRVESGAESGADKAFADSVEPDDAALSTHRDASPNRPGPPRVTGRRPAH